MTERLLARPPEDADLDALVALRRDAAVMAFPLGRAMDEAEAELAVAEQLAHWERLGYGKAALVERATGRTVGYCGVHLATFAPGMEHEPEIGWRLLPEAWGRGYASEAAHAVVRWAFDELRAPRVLCFVDPANERSLAVARRVGFRHVGVIDVAGAPHWPARPHHLSELRPRDLAAQVVERFRPVDPAQEAARSRILSLLSSDADVLARDPAGHLTASSLVVDAAGERALLLWHKKLHRWLQPGGHVDGDWDLARAALREAEEETGIAGLRVARDPVDLDVHRVAPGDAEPHDHHDIRFLVVAPPGAEPVANAEADRFRWLTADELAGDPDVDDSLRRLGRHGMVRRRGPAHELR